MTPLLRLTVFFIAGDVAGLRWCGSTTATVASVAAVCLLVALAWRRGLPQSVAPIAFTLLGVAAGGSAAHKTRNDCRTTIPDGAHIAVIAVVDGPAEPGARVTLRAEAMRTETGVIACEGAITARLPDRIPSLARGGHVLATGMWWSNGQTGRWPRPAEWSGTFSVTSIRSATDTHSHMLMVARSVALDRVRTTFPAEAPMAESLLLARRERLDVDVRDDFAAAGLAHLLAISGAHVGIIGGIVLLLAGLSGVRPQAAAVVAASVTGLYVVVLGAPAAATRAAIQGLSLLASRLTQRPAEPLTLLAVAALAIIAIDPAAPLGAGFQLSFAGVFGLFAFGPPIRRSLPERTPRFLAAAATPTLAATAATAPIAALQFGLISLIGPLSNLLAAPLLGVSIASLIAALIAGILSQPLGLFLGQGAEILLRLLRGIAHSAAHVPLGHVWVGVDSVTMVLVAVATFLICGPAVRKRLGGSREEGSRRPRIRLIARAALAGALLLVWPLLKPPPGGLEIHVIDVGQGDAIAIRTPRDQWILVDAGPATPTFDAGRERVAPYLRRRGARRIDLLVLTHPDMDHIGGARAVFEAFNVGTVMDPAVAAGKSMYLETLEAAAAAGYGWVAARAGREIDAGDIHIRVLAPDSITVDAMPEANDLSVVFRLEYGDFSALFLGDAPESVEDRMVGLYGSGLDSDVIKVGHHGSRTSTGDSLMAAVHPSVALISVGRRNRYGHPSPGVIRRLSEYGVRVVRTDSSGSIVLRASANGSIRIFATK